jgi:hypothetical protein
MAAAVALAACWLTPVSGRAGERIGEIDIVVQPLPAVEGGSGRNYGTTHGYTEFRVHLRNTAQKNHTVQLAYPAGLVGRPGQGIVATRTVALAAEQETSVVFYQPVSESTGMDMEVRVDGMAEPQTIAVPNVQGYRYDSSVCPAVLVSRDVPRDFRDYSRAVARMRQARGGQRSRMAPPEGRLDPVLPGDNSPSISGGARLNSPTAVGAPLPPGPEVPPDVPMGPPSSPGRRPAMVENEPFTLLRSEVPTSQWSPNWLGYSRFDAILLTESDVEAMTPQVRTAIRRYIECGGTVLVHGRSVPPVFSEHGIADQDAGYFVGLGYVAASLQDGNLEKKATKELDAVSGAPAGKSEEWIRTFFKLTQMPLSVYHPSQRPDKLFDLLVAEATVPVRGLFILVLLFGLGIGPANVWLLTKYKRRIWLWWNVPVISLLTCLMVFSYAVLSEGWTGRGKNATLTVLDERCHRATTFGYVSLYCPLTPSAGLHFADDTELAMLSSQVDWERNYSRASGRNSGTLRTVDWTNDQHLVSGWVTSRVPAYFQVRKNEDRRERLTVEQSGGQPPTVVNALGADIRQLYFADASGRIFEAGPIAAGSRQTLDPKDADKPAHARSLSYLRNIYAGGDWINVFNAWREISDPSAMLGPGCYIAVLDKSPFIESPLAGVAFEDTTAIVYGICKEQEDGR